MSEHARGRRIEQLSGAADRLDELAETAELMGDEAGASRFRADAASRRLRAMDLLDDADDGRGQA